MGNVLPFPRAAVATPETAKPVRARHKAPMALRMSPQQEEQIDRVAEILAERAKRRIVEWQAKRGMPGEESALIARLAVLAGSRGDGLDTMTLYQMDALLKFAGWGNDDA